MCYYKVGAAEEKCFSCSQLSSTSHPPPGGGRPEPGKAPRPTQKSLRDAPVRASHVWTCGQAHPLPHPALLNQKRWGDGRNLGGSKPQGF